MKRDWTAAMEKVSREGCRVCGESQVDAAHVAGRRYDRPVGWSGKELRVDANDVVGLCRAHHQAFDAHELDLLPYLHRAEEVAVVSHLGIARAYRRVTGKKEVPA